MSDPFSITLRKASLGILELTFIGSSGFLNLDIVKSQSVGERLKVDESANEPFESVGETVKLDAIELVCVIERGERAPVSIRRELLHCFIRVENIVFEGSTGNEAIKSSIN
jgi:hypothetical protein